MTVTLLLSAFYNSFHYQHYVFCVALVLCFSSYNIHFAPHPTPTHSHTPLIQTSTHHTFFAFVKLINISWSLLFLLSISLLCCNVRAGLNTLFIWTYWYQLVILVPFTVQPSTPDGDNSLSFCYWTLFLIWGQWHDWLERRTCSVTYWQVVFNVLFVYATPLTLNLASITLAL